MRNRTETQILPPEPPEQILEQIMSDLNLEYERERTFSYRSFVYGTYLLKRILALFIVLLLIALFIPSTIVPVGITNISAPEIAGGTFTRVGFEVTSQILIREVTAKLNNRTLPVIQEDHHYYVDVNENGNLLLETVSITGIRSSHQITIEGIDDQAPSVVRHSREGDQVVIYLTDEDGTGVDYESIYGYTPDSDLRIAPSDYNEEQGYITFPYPEARIYINIPDKGGNRLTIFLEPLEP